MNSSVAVPPLYPNCSATIRTVQIGGMSPLELLTELQKTGIKLNEAGQALFAHHQFTTSPVSYDLVTVEVSVSNLGFVQGATSVQIHDRASELGLSLCPLELGPHLRLQFRDQSEGDPGLVPRLHHAPPDSITIASQPLADDDETPKGFYLRRIKGVLWLRGYLATPAHIWSPEDLFVFSRPGTTGLPFTEG